MNTVHRYALAVNARFTKADAIRYDQRCSLEFALPSLVLMTHAAVECASIIRSEMRGPSAQVVVLCGSGNNGGDGYAIVRALHSNGIRSLALDVAPCHSGSDAHTMRDAASRMGLVGTWSDRPTNFKSDEIVIVDALVGTGLDRAPTGALLEAIHWINTQARTRCTVFSIDLPSGLDCDSGKPLGATNDAVFATRTLTIVRAKAGFATDSGRKYVGEVTEISIGGPPLTQDGQFVE